MASPQKSNTRCHIRSFSFPTKSHPTTLRIKEKLNKLITCEVSSTPPTKEICKSFSDLEELYKWVDELLDGSVRLLDTCGNTMDIICQLKEHLGDVWSCLSRRKGELSVENSIAKFTSSIKKMTKDAKRSNMALKQMDNEIGGLQILDLDQHISTVIGVLREVSAMSISFFQSLLVFLYVPVSKPNPSKWSLISNLMRKGRVASEGQVDNTNEFERVDAALSTLCKYGSSDTEKMQIAENRMEALEGHVEERERELECIFRSLIRTRASFLNVVSH